jgi:predicted amidophosphoribosyltransferase
MHEHTPTGNAGRLMTCGCCGKALSSLATTCPHCGEPARSAQAIKETDTAGAQLRVDSSASGMGKLIGLIGIVTLFFAPPIGVLMLMVSGLFAVFGKKTVAAKTGPCPNCAKPISVPDNIQNSQCPACKKPFTITASNRFRAS